MPQADIPQKKHKPIKQKHVPMRTCIACKTTKSKRELLRVVHTPAGSVELDPGGKKSGRGAYLCAKRSCWENVLKSKKLLSEFEISQIPPEDLARLNEFLQTLPAET